MIIIKAKKLNLVESSIGLMGKNTIIPIFFTTRFGIHTFGVKFPIDVVILDNNHKVVRVKQSLQPSKIFLWNPKYTNVLELPEKAVIKNKIQLNSIIKIVD